MHDWLRCSSACTLWLLNSGGGEIRAPPLLLVDDVVGKAGRAAAELRSGVLGDRMTVAYREPSSGPCVCWDESVRGERSDRTER